MALRTGTQEGRARAVDYLGIASGFLAPLTIAVFVIAGGIVVDDYSHLHNMMSDLGDREGAVGHWFLVVNLAVGFFLALFAFAVFRRLPVGRWVVLLLFVAAGLSATLGIARCTHGCPPNGIGGTRDNIVAIAHNTAAFGLLILIVIIPALASLDLQAPDPDAVDRRSRLGRWLINITRWLPQVAALPALAALVLALGDADYRGLFQRITWIIGYGFIIVTAATMYALRRGYESAPFDVRRIQENVLYGSPHRTLGTFCIGRIDDPVRFQKALRQALEDRLIRAETLRPVPALTERRSFTITVGFTSAGLDRLGVPYEWKATGPDAFGDGMRTRDVLNDPDPSPPWEHEPHVVFWIAAESTSGQSRARFAIRQAFEDTGAVSADEIGCDAKHVGGSLGFIDGLSNPWIRGVHASDDEARQGGGKLNATTNRWEPLAIGEFILGQPDETRDVFPVPEPASVFTSGTFLVLRQLEVNGDAFTTLLDTDDDDVSPEDVAAALMGRAYDGTPLAESADGESGWRNNTFTYGSDPEGFKCPLGAHVRRANPRDSLGFEGVPAHRRRIIRRGLPYSAGVDDAGDEITGLMFAAFNARIVDQFEFIQTQWLDDGDAFRLGRAPDPIAGTWREAEDEDRTFTWHRSAGPVTIELDRPIVTARGGAYFLVPSIDGLNALCVKP